MTDIYFDFFLSFFNFFLEKYCILKIITFHRKIKKCKVLGENLLVKP